MRPYALPSAPPAMLAMQGIAAIDTCPETTHLVVIVWATVVPALAIPYSTVLNSYVSPFSAVGLLPSPVNTVPEPETVNSCHPLISPIHKEFENRWSTTETVAELALVPPRVYTEDG